MNPLSPTLVVIACLAATSLLPTWTHAQEDPDPIYSGPQVGEPLTDFEITSVAGDQTETLAPLETLGDKPCVIVFIHDTTRPSFQLASLIARASKQLGDPPTTSVTVLLTDDVNSTKQWAKRARTTIETAIPDSSIGIFTEGIDGPGSYGLNRKVTMTVLVAKQGKVTANFALVQPSSQADGPRIVQAIADAAGVDVPDKLLEQLSSRGRPDQPRRRPQANPENNTGRDNEAAAKVRPLLQPLLVKSASPDEVEKAAEEAEKAMAEDAQLRKTVGDICRRIVAANVLENYGNTEAQKVLQRWADELK